MVAAEVGDVFVLPGCNNGTPMQVVVCFSNILWIHMTMGYKRRDCRLKNMRFIGAES